MAPVEAIDDLNVTFTAIEDAFVRLGLTTPAVVDMGKNRSLTFRKQDSEWGLFVTYLGKEPNTIETCPLLKTGRNTRVVAAHFLAPLHAALVAAAELTVKEVEDAAAIARAFLESIR